MPDVINTLEMAGLRREAEMWMPDVCDIYNIATVDDSYGGRTPTETIRLTGIKCDVQSGVSLVQEREIAEHLTDATLFQVTLPADTDVRVGDHIIVTSRANMHLIVQAVFGPESWEIERRAVASMEAHG